MDTWAEALEAQRGQSKTFETALVLVSQKDEQE
jgi:hypothetical protein